MVIHSQQYREGTKEIILNKIFHNVLGNLYVHFWIISLNSKWALQFTFYWLK